MTPRERLALAQEGLAAVWDTQGRSFVTFEAVEARSGSGDAPWVQYLDGVLNLEWPENEDPVTALPRMGVTLPAGAFVAFHAPGTTAHIAVGDAQLDDVATLIAALFERVLAAGVTGFELQRRIECG